MLVLVMVVDLGNRVLEKGQALQSLSSYETEELAYNEVEEGVLVFLLRCLFEVGIWQRKNGGKGVWPESPPYDGDKLQLPLFYGHTNFPPIKNRTDKYQSINNS